jgi:hypothetical protein
MRDLDIIDSELRLLAAVTCTPLRAGRFRALARACSPRSIRYIAVNSFVSRIVSFS